MLTMNKLPIPVLQLIQNYGYTYEQISLQLTNKKLKNLKITIISRCYHRLNDSILLKYKDSLQYLYIGDNRRITDVSVRELKQLRTLYAAGSPRKTDARIRE